MHTAAIVPCYRSSQTVTNVIEQCLKYVDLIVCVDDNCPEMTGNIIEELFIDNPKVILIRHKRNLGVGGAIKTGVQYLKNLDVEIFVKIDSDAQMDPSQIPNLILPIREGKALVCKGNRFRNAEIIKLMPLTRLIGNAGLSFITKLSTGYWELFDPTNGFIALSRKAISRIEINKTDNRYFFETDLLLRCSLSNIKIQEVPMKAIYQGEVSSLKPHVEFFRFSFKHFLIFIKRVGYQYFLLEINPGSLELCGGVFCGGIAFLIGLRSIIMGWQTGLETPAGTQTLFLAMLIISLQLTLGFIYYDSTFRPLMREIKSKE